MPKCHLVVSARWKTTGTGRRAARKKPVPVLVVSYTCDQKATVRIDGAVTIPAAGRGRKRTRARTIALTPATSHAAPGTAAPAVVLSLPATVVKAVRAGARTPATVTFTVKNANGVGVATLKVIVAPQGKGRA